MSPASLFLSLLLLALIPQDVITFSTGAGTCTTPGSCMSFSSNSGVIWSFNNGATQIEAGKTYSVTLTSNTTQDLAGFLLYAQDATGFRQGLWTLKSNTQFKTCTGTTGSSISHSTASGWGRIQTFSWTAPTPAVNLTLKGVGVRKSFIWSELTPIQLTAVTAPVSTGTTRTTGSTGSTGSTASSGSTGTTASTGTTRSTSSSSTSSSTSSSSSSSTGSSATLSIKLSGPKTYTKGQTANVTITVKNDGSATVRNLVTSLKIKKKISLVSVDGGCQAKGSGYQCQVSQLDAGKSLTYKAVVQVDGDGTLIASVLDSAGVTLVEKSLKIKL